MTIFDGMNLGRWHGTTAVLAALALALVLAACGQEAVANETTGPMSEEELAALAAEVGPDWEVVEEYRKSQQEWMKRALDSLGSQEEGGEASGGDEGDVESDRPDISRAAAAAIAILEHEGGHEKRDAAARFLVTEGAMVPEGDQLAYRGAKALFDGGAEVQAWPMLLARMDMTRRYGDDGTSSRPAIDRFFGELASDAEDPVHRAAGRFYVASGLAASIDVVSLSSAERAARRERALEAASGLSAGVENESLMLGAGVRSFAEIEKDLIQVIRHATVGATAPDVAGTGLDGVPEALSDYRGRVVLLDFWATWCKPCIAALPELRQLVADLPEERFALLAISVDGELDTATDFIKSEPMPFAHWYVGMASDVTRILNVSSYPTYILLDEEGRIVARTNALRDDFLVLVEETVQSASEA